MRLSSKNFISLAKQDYHYDATEEHFLFQLEQYCNRDNDYSPNKIWNKNVVSFYKKDNYFSIYEGGALNEDNMLFLAFREIRIKTIKINDWELKLEVSCGITKSNYLGLYIVGLIYIGLFFINITAGIFVFLIFISCIIFFKYKSYKDIKYFIDNYLPKSTVSSIEKKN